MGGTLSSYLGDEVPQQEVTPLPRASSYNLAAFLEAKWCDAVAAF